MKKYYQFCISAINFDNERVRINRNLYDFTSKNATYEFAKHLEKCGYSSIRIIIEKVEVIEVITYDSLY